MASLNERAVGRSVARKDGIGKAPGKGIYADHLVFPGRLYGRTIRAAIPRGRVREIRRNFDADGFTVVDFRDIPGKNVIALIEEDQPCLVEERVRPVPEPILLLRHSDRGWLLGAAVDNDYERDTPGLDPAASDVVFKQIHIRKGDV